MKKSFFVLFLLAVLGLGLTSCDSRTINYNIDQYNDEFVIRADDWQWDVVHRNWFYTFNDYTIMNRTLVEYGSVTACQVLFDNLGNRSMRALPYSATWFDTDAGLYYTLELNYEFGRGWIQFTYTDSFHTINQNPGDVVIRVTVLNGL